MKKIIFIILSSIFLISSISYGVFLEIVSFAKALERSFVPIRFVNAGNHFAGALFITNIEDKQENICIGSTCKTCNKILHGYYWSHGHKFFVWPLTNREKDILKNIAYNSDFYNNLSINGGFLTACEGEPESVYGYIEYKYNNSTIFKLFAGIETNKNTNFIPNGNFSQNLQYVQGYTLFGLITDTISGIGVVGTNSEIIDGCISDFIDRANNTGITKFVYIDSGGNISLDWDKSCSSLTGSFVGNQVGNVLAFRGIYTYTTATAKALKDLFILNVGREQGTNVQYSIYTDQKNFSDFMNYLRKRANIVCRGRLKDIREFSKFSDGTLILNGTDDIICIKSDSDDIKIKSQDLKGKNLIVFNGNVILTGNSITDDSIHIFIDRGNLILDIVDLVPIDGEGNYDTTNVVTSGVYINGDLFVNGLIFGKGYPYFDHKLYIHGRVAFLNTVGVPNQKRINFVNYIVGDTEKWSTDPDNDEKDYIDLNTVFRRRCDFANGIGTDGVSCGDEKDRYSLYSIILVYKRWANNVLLNN